MSSDRIYTEILRDSTSLISIFIQLAKDYRNLIFMSFGLTEILVILFFLLLFFGARKIPELMRGIGKGIREFKSGQEEDKKDTKT